MKRALTDHDINTYFRLIAIINEEGSFRDKHWAALMYKADKICVDSLGTRLLKEVDDLLKNYLHYNTYRVVAFDNKKYGYFCIDFITNVMKIETFHEWLLGYDVKENTRRDDWFFVKIQPLKNDYHRYILFQVS